MKSILLVAAVRIAIVAICVFAIGYAYAVEKTHAQSAQTVADPVMNTLATKPDLGVMVTNETDTNIVVFSTAGTQGCTVLPGKFCFVPCPPGWSYLGVKVVRCGKDGDMEDPDDRVTFGFRMDAVKVYRVKPREF